jgi:uncharacterized protein (TIGR00375 family)
MEEFDSDLHIHSPYSIAVSQTLNLETMLETAIKKGLKIIGTGDITQPDWRNYLKENLKYKDGIYSFNDLNFIIQTELEDSESIHHLVFLPDLHAGEVLQEKLNPFVKNIEGRWAGRPHVNKTPAEIVEIIETVGGISGPAHAFTPFKSIFRQGKFSTLTEAYGTAVKKVPFIELGLSANTDLADRIESLQDVTFLSNSDAHSQGIQSLGREFNRIQMEFPTFDELKMALERKKGRKVTMNVGLDPMLGKYYIMFCSKCRRRVLRKINTSNEKSNSLSLFGLGKADFDDEFIRMQFPSKERENEYIKQVAQGKIKCIGCEKEAQISTQLKNQKKASTMPKLSLGVSERIDQIATWPEPRHPIHRPPYLNFLPLIEILRSLKKVKSKTSNALERSYNQLISEIGTEFHILIDTPIEILEKYENGDLSQIIDAFRKKQITYIPGGGGTFGEINFDAFE